MTPTEGPNQKNRSHPTAQGLRPLGDPQDSNRPPVVGRPLALITLTNCKLARSRGPRPQGLNQQAQWLNQCTQQP